LESARDLAADLAHRMQSDDFDGRVVDAFSTAILVRYARPFTTGVRRKLGPEVLNALSPEQSEPH